MDVLLRALRAAVEDLRDAGDVETPDSERLQVGRLGRSHGLAGEVFCRAISDLPGRFEAGSVLELESGEELHIEGSRSYREGYLLRLVGVGSPEAAKMLAGQNVYVPKSSHEGFILVHEVIGARVREADGTDRGVVVAVQENPAHELLVTSLGALIPVVFVTEWGSESVTVDVPEGLFDL
jgi:ribosomal 30S subunit maturation factor RimM